MRFDFLSLPFSERNVNEKRKANRLISRNPLDNSDTPSYHKPSTGKGDGGEKGAHRKSKSFFARLQKGRMPQFSLCSKKSIVGRDDKLKTLNKFVFGN